MTHRAIEYKADTDIVGYSTLGMAAVTVITGGIGVLGRALYTHQEDVVWANYFLTSSILSLIVTIGLVVALESLVKRDKNNYTRGR